MNATTLEDGAAAYTAACEDIDRKTSEMERLQLGIDGARSRKRDAETTLIDSVGPPDTQNPSRRVFSTSDARRVLVVEWNGPNSGSTIQIEPLE